MATFEGRFSDAAGLRVGIVVARFNDLVTAKPVSYTHLTLPMAIAAGAAGVGVGSAVNRLQDELAMVAVVRGLRDALGSAVATRV